MIKYIFILINFAGLFFINLFSDTEVLVDNQTPTNLVPGEKKEVHITINKKDIQGFAKMELVLPAGFVATPGETQGASFTYTQQKARFVWMTLPTTENFDVTYYLECIDGMKGNYSVNGTFSYIRDNKRVDYVIPIKSIVVGSTPAPVAASENTAPSSASASAEASVETPATNTVATPAQEEANTAAAPATPSATQTSSSVTTETSIPASAPTISDLYCDRTVEKTADNTYKVELIIHNNNIEGFAKILEVLPSGCTATAVQDGGAVTTTEKNTIKFVWFEIPTSPEIHLLYQVNCSTEPNITGKLSFVQNSRPMELEITNSGANVDTEALALDMGKVKGEDSNSNSNKSEKSSESTTNTENKSPEKEVKKADDSKKSGDNLVVSRSEKESETIDKSDLSPETGITYKVQILAAHRVVNKTYFQQKHSFGERFNIENHEGWVKYTTGKFSEYKDARDNRERIRKDYSTLPGPFVTAYNNGERITVQEALLITKQQWYN